MPTEILPVPNLIEGQSQGVVVVIGANAAGLMDTSSFINVFPSSLAATYAQDTSVNLAKGGTYLRNSIDCYYYNKIHLAVGASHELVVQPQLSFDNSNWYNWGTATTCPAGYITSIPGPTQTLFLPTRYFRYLITNNSGTATTWIRSFIAYSL